MPSTLIDGSNTSRLIILSYSKLNELNIHFYRAMHFSASVVCLSVCLPVRLSVRL